MQPDFFHQSRNFIYDMPMAMKLPRSKGNRRKSRHGRSAARWRVLHFKGIERFNEGRYIWP